jgi:hypothetical protein
MLLLLFACNAPQAGKESIAAADMLTRDYAQRELRASVAGTDCTILLIRSKTPLDIATIESIHYGTGEYAAKGAVERFAERRRFRAVVYRDPSGIVQTYGSITRDEAQSMPRCR